MLSELDVRAPEERWETVEGREIQGWLIRCAAAERGEPAPLVLEIHGGPHTLYGWAPYWEFQVLAAAGISVLYTNPRGSEGYGEDFNSANLPDWGDGPMRDVMAHVDALVAAGVADPARLGVTGGSYGGYLTNWIVGHTDRFAAAMTCRSVSDLTSLMLTGDLAGGIFGILEFGAQPWEDADSTGDLADLASRERCTRRCSSSTPSTTCVPGGPGRGPLHGAPVAQASGPPHARPRREPRADARRRPVPARREPRPGPRLVRPLPGQGHAEAPPAPRNRAGR